MVVYPKIDLDITTFLSNKSEESYLDFLDMSSHVL